jgi:hypothetical protein
MTRYARLALDDCRVALDQLRAEPTGQLWRVRWVGAVALLRSVGHVLKNVDRNSDQKLRSAIDSTWQELSNSKPEPLILWKFIEEERNNVLKEYRTTAREHVIVQPPTAHYNLAAGEESESGAGRRSTIMLWARGHSLVRIPATLSRPQSGGGAST